MIKTFYFNTGVKFSDYPYLCEGQVERGGTKQIPFDCEDVPDNATFMYGRDDPNLFATNDPQYDKVIVREIHNSTLMSKYAYFSMR